MSQEALAKAMAEKGHKWHQSTVYKVLNDARKVALGEAVSIAEILEMPVARMAEGSTDIVEMSKIKILHSDLLDLRERLVRNVQAYETARYRLQGQIGDGSDPWTEGDQAVLALFAPDELKAMREATYDSAADIARQPPF